MNRRGGLLVAERKRGNIAASDSTTTRSMATMDEFSVTLRRFKETPGTIVFKAEDRDALLRDVYLDKRAFKGGAIPDQIVVTLREAPSERTR
jgi:hypothetical protein